MSLHTSEGTKTTNCRCGPKSNHKTVAPSKLGVHCSTPGNHSACKYLVALDVKGVRKPPKNWCDYLGEEVKFIDRRPVRIGECLADFGKAEKNA